jgi:hypothetical protein
MNSPRRSRPNRLDVSLTFDSWRSCLVQVRFVCESFAQRRYDAGADHFDGLHDLRMR